MGSEKLLLTIVSVLFAGIIYAGNIIPNPDFKSANHIYPNGWYAHQAAPRKLTNFTTADGVASISQKSPSVINQLILTVPLAKAKKLTVKMDYKLDMLQKNGGILYHFTDKSGKRMHEAAFILATRQESSRWKNFSKTIPVPAGAAKITLTLAVYGGANYPEGRFFFRNPVVEIAE